jgi:hypothetical protein
MPSPLVSIYLTRCDWFLARYVAAGGIDTLHKTSWCWLPLLHSKKRARWGITKLQNVP